MLSTSLCRRFENLQSFRFVALLVGVACQPASPTGNPPPVSSLCVNCHLSEFEVTTQPPHAGVRPSTCGTCHSTDGWHPYRLQHSWPLENAHAKANCFSCHAGTPPQFEGTNKTCVNCHQAAQSKADATVARHSSFPPTCEMCHGTSAWKPSLPHEIAPAMNTSTLVPHLSARAATRHAAAAPSAISARKTPNAVTKPVIVKPTPTINRPTPDVVSGASTARRQ